jgi:hypothetical protein
VRLDPITHLIRTRVCPLNPGVTFNPVSTSVKARVDTAGGGGGGGFIFCENLECCLHYWVYLHCNGP